MTIRASSESRTERTAAIVSDDLADDEGHHDEEAQDDVDGVCPTLRRPTMGSCDGETSAMRPRRPAAPAPKPLCAPDPSASSPRSTSHAGTSARGHTRRSR
jgi:hypothetical protein